MSLFCIKFLLLKYWLRITCEVSHVCFCTYLNEYIVWCILSTQYHCLKKISRHRKGSRPFFWLTKEWISCTAEQSYCYPVCVHLYHILWLLVHTLCLAQLCLCWDLWNTHFVWISCTAVQSYSYPVCVHLYGILSLLVYTLCFAQC